MSKKKNLMMQSLVKSVTSVEVEVTILPELRDLIPPLGQEEFAQLEANILAEGCREPLLLWTNPEGKHILIDGHNRHRICQKHGLKFEISSKAFADLEAVKSWMIDNQLGRRNLKPEQVSYLRGLRYNTEKQAKGGDRKSKGHFVTLNASEKLADEYKVSERTIKRDAEFAKGLDFIGQANPDLKKQILAGEVKVKKSDVQLLGKQTAHTLPPLQTAEDLTNIRQHLSPKKPTKKVSKKAEKAPAKTSARQKKQQQRAQKLKTEIAEKVLQITQPADFDRIETLLQKLKKIVP